MKETRWLFRFESNGKPRKWVEVRPLYSDIQDRMVRVMDPERGKYLAGPWGDLRDEKPEERQRAA